MNVLRFTTLNFTTINPELLIILHCFSCMLLYYATVDSLKAIHLYTDTHTHAPRSTCRMSKHPSVGYSA